MNSTNHEDKSLIEEFQKETDSALVRHRSVLDIMSKFSEASARTNRSITKAVTTCGCISIKGEKQLFEDDIENSLPNLKNHIEGILCENCQEAIENEIGNSIFYLTSIANSLDMDLENILENELNKLKTLGVFNLK